MRTVIIVSIILFIVIMGLTIAHITGGYRVKQTIDEVDPDPTNKKLNE